MAKKTEKERIIMGIDPGTTIMGYAIIRAKGNILELLIMGVLDLKKYGSHYEKLGKIYERISAIMKEYKPEELAIEAPFFGKNVQSMLKLGRAQGVAIAAALAEKMSVHEYAPKKIKSAITGSGNASKEQLAGILKYELGLTEMPEFLDSTDALGAAVCHFHQTRNPLVASLASNNWTDFIKNNPDRIKT